MSMDLGVLRNEFAVAPLHLRVTTITFEVRIYMYSKYYIRKYEK